MNGFYPAYRRMAEEDLDFVAHLGDYIYEGPGAASDVRAHLPAAEIMSLDDYRIRHALYKSDPALQAAHAACPWIVTWDDHETENDYAGLIPQDAADAPIFEERRARAYQAYYEHMPLRRFSVPTRPRSAAFSPAELRRALAGSRARHAAVQVRARTRGLRARAASRRLLPVRAADPTRTITGDGQRDWLIDGLTRSRADWNVLANQVPFAPNDTNADPAVRTFGGEKWDGYPFNRAEVLDVIAAQKLYNTVVITGDVHQSFVRNVPPDYVNLDAEPVATEFIGTSISSGGDRTISTTVRWQCQQSAPAVQRQSSWLCPLHGLAASMAVGLSRGAYRADGRCSDQHARIVRGRAGPRRRRAGLMRARRAAEPHG